MATFRFEPREFQKKLLTDPARFKVWVMHRRFGKTYLAVRMLVIKALQDTKVRPQYAYFSPEGEQGEKIAWPEFIQCLEGLPGIRINNQKKIITFEHNNAHIYVLGLKEPGRVRGMYFDGIVMDEYGDIQKDAWGEVIYPTLTDRKGFCVIMGTPKGHDGLYEMYDMAAEYEKDNPELWSARKYTVEDTDVFSDQDIKEMKMNMLEAQFEQEYMCNFEADFSNRYYLELIQRAKEQGRVGEFYYDPKFPVYTAWDLGRDTTAVWFAQKINKQIVLIDYWQKQNCRLEEAFNMLNGRGYVYRKHFLPHDAVQLKINTDYSIRDQFKNQGFNVQVLPKTGVNQGISAVQAAFPNCKFNTGSTKEGLEALENYQAKVSKKEGVMLDQPAHNKFSHGADAFRYLILGIDKADNMMGIPRHKWVINTEYNEFDI
tara:strand:- start:14241 stop:15527 length:1287 start_codon:yes stop_codon:yes gene_type:complete